MYLDAGLIPGSAGEAPLPYAGILITGLYLEKKKYKVIMYTGTGYRDGQLVDVSETPEAKEAGFRVPVCLTVGVHALVQVPELLSR